MRLEKLIMTNPVSDFFTETFDLLSSGQFENLVFRPESQGGKFLQALSLWVRCRRRFFFSAKKAPIFLQALSFWVRCRRRLFFSAKKGPIFLQALSFWVRCRRRFFFGKKGPHISGHGSTRSGHGSSGHGTEIFGTARIIRARHGNIWHGTDPPDLGTARHGTSLHQGSKAARIACWPLKATMAEI